MGRQGNERPSTPPPPLPEVAEEAPPRSWFQRLCCAKPAEVVAEAVPVSREELDRVDVKKLNYDIGILQHQLAWIRKHNSYDWKYNRFPLEEKLSRLLRVRKLLQT